MIVIAALTTAAAVRAPHLGIDNGLRRASTAGLQMAYFTILDSTDKVIGEFGGEGMEGYDTEAASAAQTLGKGHFGKVLLGRSDQGTKVAIKVMPQACTAPLAAEAAILSELNGKDGFPRFLFHGSEANVLGAPSDVLVMELLGASLLERCESSTAEDDMCTPHQAISSRVYSAESALRIGRQCLSSLQTLGELNLVHNDIKPSNLLFGAECSGRENQVHIIDFGGVTQGGALPTRDFTCGGGTPLFVSLAGMEGRNTRPVDDVESLWYVLAYLAHGLQLPWNWEPPDRVANIKRQLFIDECAIAADGCEAKLLIDECCSTRHCRETVESWLELETLTQTDEPLAAALQSLWSEVLDAQGASATVDYAACLRALGAEGDGSEPPTTTDGTAASKDEPAGGEEQRPRDEKRPDEQRADGQRTDGGDGSPFEVAAFDTASTSSPALPYSDAPLPPLIPLSRGSYTDLVAAHSFSRKANWLIPGRVMCGHYPGGCPSDEYDRVSQAMRLARIRDSGICTFVCLQSELPPQDSPWPEGGIPKQGDRVKFATNNFTNYRADAEVPVGGSQSVYCDATFLHYGMPDLSTAKSVEVLDEIVRDIEARLIDGDGIYLHCWGGRGRTGLVAACLLGALYTDISAEDALERVQTYYDLRQPSPKKSPETEEQRQQVRDWFAVCRDL